MTKGTRNSIKELQKKVQEQMREVTFDRETFNLFSPVTEEMVNYYMKINGKMCLINKTISGNRINTTRNEYHYDENGHLTLIHQVDARPVRMVGKKKSKEGPKNILSKIKYFYDDKGRIIRELYDNREVNYEYGKKYNVKTVEFDTPSGKISIVTKMDSKTGVMISSISRINDLPIEIRKNINGTYMGIPSLNEIITCYNYDENGNEISIHESVNKWRKTDEELLYHHEKEIQVVNGKKKTVECLKTEYILNETGKIIGFIVNGTDKFLYRFDKKERIIKIYNELSGLTTLDIHYRKGYEEIICYDPDGNICRIQRNGKKMDELVEYRDGVYKILYDSDDYYYETYFILSDDYIPDYSYINISFKTGDHIIRMTMEDSVTICIDESYDKDKNLLSYNKILAPNRDIMDKMIEKYDLNVGIKTRSVYTGEELIKEIGVI